ncbi:MAG: hypothetical protein IPO36_21525 [Anaerolineales bacterium]|nr:hypothetical protein [Anaerolineales bacterium]
MDKPHNTWDRSLVQRNQQRDTNMAAMVIRSAAKRKGSTAMEAVSNATIIKPSETDRLAVPDACVPKNHKVANP